MSDINTLEYGRYLASLMGSVINDTAPEKPFEGIDWEYMRRLANHHNVLSLIYPGVSSLNIPKEIFSNFYYDSRLLLTRSTRQEIEAQLVSESLNNEGIRFIKLKGIVLEKFYPKSYMRSHSDIDLFMSKEDRERAKRIMKDLGYTLASEIDYNDEYEKDKFYLFELHSSLVTDSSPYKPLLSDPFKNTVKDADGINFVLSDEYFYLHLIIHLLNHFLSGGCGVRQLCDIYVFEKTHPQLDLKFIEEKLESFGLSKFLSTMRKLCVALFEGKKLTKDEEDIASFIFSSGEYGSGNLKHISWLSKDKHITWTFSKKCGYFLKLWFPPVSTMKRRYPILEKAPVLLPVCWIRRIFYAIFFKRNSVKEQYHEIKQLNSDELKEAKRVRNLAGLK